MYNMNRVPRLNGVIIPSHENQQNERDQKLLKGGKNQINEEYFST
jgi:hypothetical protein